MRTTDTLTISLPPAMAKQMEKVQKEEHRTRSELLREAWRQCFESRYPVYTPTRAELTAIYVTLNQLHNELDSARCQTRAKRSRKTS